MKKVNPVALLGQGTAPSCACAPFQPLTAPEPGPSEASPLEEATALEGLAPPEAGSSFLPPEAGSSLLEDRSLPEFRPHPHFAVRPRTDQPLEETIQRSLARRAARVVRPHLEGIPREELWVVAFDERCLLVGSERLAVREEGQPLAAPLSLLGWAEAKGARAMVLVQNQPGRQAATPLALLPTLKVAAAATLFGLILVDHIILHGGGSVTQLRRRTALVGAQAFAVQFQTDLEDLAASHRGFGLPRTPETSALG